jgi:hypothetical protein
MWVQGISWLGGGVRSAPEGRTQVSRRFPVQESDQQILTRRLGTDDPYWWILAGGIHVPGFGPAAEPDEALSPGEVPTGRI